MRRPGIILLLLAVVAGFLAVIPTYVQTPADPPDDGVFNTVVLGDSVARGAGDERDLGIPGWLDRELRVRTENVVAPVNLGINGARTGNVMRLLRNSGARSAIARADLIVLSIGGNDLYGDSRARLLSGVVPWFQRQRVEHRVDRLVERLRELNPAAQVCVLGLYNPYRRGTLGPWLDEQVNLWDGGLIQRLAARPGVTVVRIADLLGRADRLSPLDRFHPGTAGYAAIARRLVDGMSAASDKPVSS